MNQTLKDWIQTNGRSLRCRKKKPKLVLNLSESDDPDFGIMDIYLTDLLDVIVKNKDEWNVTLSVDNSISTEVSIQYSKLFDEIGCARS
ncbi:unnamed protein product [Ambrosiozyma monospora]|uniref:Unnamed protein product n=1 Tax=Ambrosiozyma monospora TaxID=43982 RepID=A0ACB5T4N0_AMBMO|nr:unnamed protein product [Ambrosiozyma monospora]